jgi:hypothetical protein
MSTPTNATLDQPAAPAEYCIDELGFKIDPETGEVLGHVQDDLREPFCIDTSDKVDWALRLFTEIDIDVATLQSDAELVAVRARYQALEKNIGTMISRQQKRRAYLLFRWGPDLKRFCEQNVTKDQRSVQSRYGTLKLRAVNKQTIEILDKDKAFEWAVANNRLDVLKREFYISQFTKDDVLPAIAFKVTGPHNSFSIVTNVSATAQDENGKG